MSQPPVRPNRLIHETSPYLLQHAYNPVDWYPWGEEALEKARRENKPILLSIGYSACHWCHVMERESFSDPEIAAFMNEHFVNIKVDREERPDLDEIYQTAAQLLGAQGGWPLTVFLTPDQKPFYAGTYFPPDDRYGRPGFLRVMQILSRAYREDPGRVAKSADKVAQALRRVDERAVDPKAPIAAKEGAALTLQAVEWLAHYFDHENGGFGTQPKFPNPVLLELFLRYAVRSGESTYLEMAVKALKSMAQGGIYDHLGGGFHRYSTDEKWLIPHFEKMLYDNALLPPVYLDAYQLTGEPLFVRVVRETLAYVDREMSHPDGGFYSSQDADSEGEEGKFFVWRPEEVERAVGKELASLFCDAYGVTPAGNFEKGASVLHVAMPLEALAKRHGLSPDEARERLQEARGKLLTAREQRVKPGRDEKVITSWNAMMISAYAKAARILDEPAYAARARRAAAFIESRLVDGERLLRSFKERPAQTPGYLEDYAFWVQALIDLYEVTFERRFLEQAGAWMERTLAAFWDASAPGFYFTPEGHEALIHRPKDWRDQGIPSGTGVSLKNLLRLHPAFDERGYLEKAQEVLEAYRRQLDQNPWATGSLHLAYEALIFGATEVVLVTDAPAGDRLKEFQKVLGRHYLPHSIVHQIQDREAEDPKAPLLWRGKRALNGAVTAYVCRGGSCSPPVTEPGELDRLLARA